VFQTIDDLRRNEWWLELRCLECERCVHVPHPMLPRRCRPDLPIHLAAGFFRCRCGSKQLRSRAVDLMDPGRARPHWAKAWWE